MRGVGCAQTEEVRQGGSGAMGHVKPDQISQGPGCCVGSVDPRRLSTERISEARFGFSAASPVSRHEACGLQPLQLVQIPQEKVKGPLDKARGHPADS